MDRRMFHKLHYKKTELPPLTKEQAYYEASSNYKLTGSSMETLYVLPTGTNINLNDIKKNEFMEDSIKDPDDNTVLYIFEKHVNTKKPVFSAIASSGKLDLRVGEKYLLTHDQTHAKICEATLNTVISLTEYKNTSGKEFNFKSMSLMVFK